MLEIVGMPLEDERAGIDKHHRITHLGQLAQDVAGDEERLAARREQPDEVLELQPRLRIEAGSRLIEDHELRVGEEHPAEAEPLRHPLGELCHLPVGEGPEVGKLDHLFDPLAALSGGEAVRPGEEVEILKHRHRLVGAERIGHPADEAADLAGVLDDIEVVDDDAP